MFTFYYFLFCSKKIQKTADATGPVEIFGPAGLTVSPEFAASAALADAVFNAWLKAGKVPEEKQPSVNSCICCEEKPKVAKAADPVEPEPVEHDTCFCGSVITPDAAESNNDKLAERLANQEKPAKAADPVEPEPVERDTCVCGSVITPDAAESNVDRLAERLANQGFKS